MKQKDNAAGALKSALDDLFPGGPGQIRFRTTGIIADMAQADYDQAARALEQHLTEHSKRH
jgi:hypothetical protein